jgi:hypothetical protein
MPPSTPLQPSADLVEHATPAEELSRKPVVSYEEYEAWEFVHFLSAHLASLETRAAILMPAQVAALIAVWTQFYTFEEDLPHGLVWAAWAALVLALVGAAWLITPPRLTRRSLLAFGLAARPAAGRADIVEELSAIVQNRVRRLHTGLIVSVGLTVLALGLLVLAYAVDKVFYPP